MSMGSRIKELRELRHLSRNKLAKLIGVSPSAISNYENDLSAPKEEILYKLFEVLKCDANYLYQDYMDEVEIFTTTFSEQELIRKTRLMNGYDLETLNIVADRLLHKGSSYLDWGEFIKVEDDNEIQENENDFDLLAAHGSENLDEEGLEQLHEDAKRGREIIKRKKTKNND